MTRQVLGTQFAKGGSGLTDGKLATALREAMHKTAVVAGAAAGTQMNIAALRPEDTLISVIAVLDAAASVNTPADDVANCTIVDLRATGTVTVNGDPAAGNTVTIKGDVYTWRASQATRTGIKDVLIVAGNNNQMAANLAAAINAWETRRKSYAVTGSTPGEVQNTPEITAVAAANVVTITAVAEGVAGNAFTLAKVGANLAVSGANLAGGSATGGFKSTTNNTGKTLTVTWADKNY